MPENMTRTEITVADTQCILWDTGTHLTDATMDKIQQGLAAYIKAKKPEDVEGVVDMVHGRLVLYIGNHMFYRLVTPSVEIAVAASPDDGRAVMIDATDLTEDKLEDYMGLGDNDEFEQFLEEVEALRGSRSADPPLPGIDKLLGLVAAAVIGPKPKDEPKPLSAASLDRIVALAEEGITRCPNCDDPTCPVTKYLQVASVALQRGRELGYEEAWTEDEDYEDEDNFEVVARDTDFDD